jgi:cystathionine beta-lyase
MTDWERNLGTAIRLSVEHRDQGRDGGPTLRVWAGERELLRFDCFVREPHYHFDPDGRDEILSLDPLADNIAWTIGELRRDWVSYLEKAGLTQAGAQRPGETELRETLDAAEAAMRNPVADLDGLDVRVLQSRVTEKWNTYPEAELNAWVAEMDYPLARPIQQVLQTAVDRSDAGYPIAPNETGLREVFAERMAERFDWQIDPRRVEILTDVVQGMYVSLEAYSRPGEGVVVQTPIYPPFLQSVRETERTLVENELVATTNGYAIDFDQLAKAADARTRVVLLCHPHNPTGRVFTRRELERLAELACERDWIVVTNEIHQDLVYAPARHIPFATLSEEVAARSVTITSATKAFNIPGLRTAVAHFGSPGLHQRFNRAFPRHVRGGIGTLGLYCTIAAWRHSQPWLDQVHAYLDANRQFLRAYLTEHMPEVVHNSPEATYLAWLDCRALELAPSPAAFFLKQAGVALSDGQNFGAQFKGFARLNFATSRDILTQILDRMKGALATR